jgi:hypothetical protein
MARRIQYDLDAVWDDPTERQADRRQAVRVETHLSVKIAVRVPEQPQALVGPGIVDNISVMGMYCRSKHTLSPGQAVEIYIPLKDCPRDMGLPRALMGTGRVVWLKAAGDKVLGTAIRFDPELADDIHLAIFVDYLGTLSKANTPPPRSIYTPFPGAGLPAQQRI